MKSYNHLYFTEKSRFDAATKNANFWSRISDLREANPSIEIIITTSLDNKWGYFYEILSFECDNPDLLKKATMIYNDNWYPYGLDLYPEFAHLTLEEILSEK